MRLLQGAGPRGLGGIAPVRGLLIRPLIETRRRCDRGVPGRDAVSPGPRTRATATSGSSATASATTCCPSWRSSPAPRWWRRSAARRRRPARWWPTWKSGPARSSRAWALATGPAGASTSARSPSARPSWPRRSSARPPSCSARRARCEGPPSGRCAGCSAEAPRRRAARLGRLAVERSGRRLRVGPVALSALAARVWPVPGALELPEIHARLAARIVARAGDYAVPRAPGRVAFDADRAAVRARGARPPPRRRLLAVRRARAAAAQIVPDRRGRPAVAARARRRSSRRAARSSGSRVSAAARSRR